MTKTVYIRTLGCPKNETDTEHLKGMLEKSGYSSVDDADNADVVIVNTCSFIDAARRESVDAILEEVDSRREGQRVLVSGCLVERYGKELADELPEVDGFMSLGSYARTAEIVEGARRGVRQMCFDAGKVPLGIDLRPAPSSPTAFVKISEGCDRVCTFCAIPMIRGGHRSRPQSAIKGEVRWLVSRGVKEVVLVAQDMSLYGRDTEGEWMLPQLLRSLGDVEGLVWLRMLYQYPRFVNETLLDAVADSTPAVPYFDLSLQHASAKLVRKMRRWGDGDRFIDLIGRIRDRFPDASLRSAFIVGFPGETETDAEMLADFLPKARLDWAGFFPYSHEEGTEAGGFSKRRVPQAVAQRRAEVLDQIQNEIAETKRAELVGAEVDVLVESRDGTSLRGRTWREAPEVDAEAIVAGARGARVGDILRARVRGTDGLDLVCDAV
ncbi:MAG: 30S ribosomal protein S12 methylthiotransferase RimO [Actinomycetota bacterium]